MIDRIHCEVDVQIGPVEMVGLRLLDVEDGLDRGGLEPRKLLERQKQLAVIDQQPETVT